MSPTDARPARLAIFLRGINLGGRRVKKEALAAPFRNAGFTGVESYLASGNIVVDAPAPFDQATIESTVEAAVRSELGFSADAFVRPLEGLARIVRNATLLDGETEGFTPHVIFLKEPPTPAVAHALQSMEGPDDRFPVLGHEVLWLRRGRLSDSEIQPRHLEKALGGLPNTMRKVTTLRRMVKKFG